MYEKLKSVRKNSKSTVKILCKLLGLKTDAAYFKKETGVTNFTIQDGMILAKHFNTTLDGLFWENN